MSRDYDEDIQNEVKLHLQEADIIKKQWFSYVYKSIDDLSHRVETTALKVEMERVEVLEKLSELRELLSKDIKAGCLDQTKQLEKVENRIERMMGSMSLKVDSVNVSDIRLQLDSYTQEVEERMNKSLKDYSDKTDEKLIEMSKIQIELKTKIKSYAVVSGLIITVIATTISSMVGSYFIKLLGGG